MAATSMWRPNLTIFLALSILDIATTWLGMAVGLPESNSLPVLLLNKGGPAAMYGAKAAMTLLIMLCVVRLSPYYTRVWGGMRFANFVMYLVVSLNLLQILAA